MILVGAIVELAPLDVERDVEALFVISSGHPCVLGDRRIEAYDADERIWKWMFGGPYSTPAALGADLAALVAEPDALPLVVRDRPTGRPIGVAAYLANRPADLAIEIGAIWYGPIAQGTGASREATQLMCGHAFGLGYRRVEWKCDARNLRSRRAAESYGFTYEGVQDAHMIVKGRNRDTAWFRLLDHEWPHPAIAVERASAPTDEVRGLVAELEAELSAEYPPEQRHGLALDALFAPDIEFFLARDRGAPVGCGGVALGPDEAEVKRMYVRAGSRGTGVAAAVLARIEATARAAGRRVLRLETGTHQRAAIKFYERAGFRRCGAFGEYAAMTARAIATSLFFEKDLVTG